MTLEEFKAWVLAQPDEDTYAIRDENCCPIACYLKKTSPPTGDGDGEGTWGYKPRVYPDHYYDSDDNYQELPTWAQDFVGVIDEEGGESHRVSKEDVLRVLNAVTPTEDNEGGDDEFQEGQEEPY